MKLTVFMNLVEICKILGWGIGTPVWDVEPKKLERPVGAPKTT
jgi:hypothetical protein